MIRGIESGILHRVCSLCWKLNTIIIVDFFYQGTRKILQTFISLYPAGLWFKITFFIIYQVGGVVSKLDIHIIKNLNSVHLEVKISPGSPSCERCKMYILANGQDNKCFCTLK